ncbi:MAG: hypothetical protein WCD46_03770, partial [Desulfobacterales bacterium]
ARAVDRWWNNSQPRWLGDIEKAAFKRSGWSQKRRAGSGRQLGMTQPALSYAVIRGELIAKENGSTLVD